MRMRILIDKYDNIYIDVSNFYYRAYSVKTDLSTRLDSGKEILTGGILISLKMIEKLEKSFLRDRGKIFFIFDNVHSGENKRKKIDPEYKANRFKREDSFYASLDYFHYLLLNMKDNYVVVKRPGSEADDLVSPLIENSNKNETHLLVSNDKDWFRSISNKVHVAKYENKDYVIYDKEHFEKVNGYEPTSEKICIYKSFRGDGSDNIPKGVSGLREDDLKYLINNFDSLTEIMKNVDNLELSDIWKEKIRQNRSRILLNYKLVSFDPVPYEELKQYMFSCKFSPRILKTLYESLNFDYLKVDSRMVQYFPKKKNDSSFFVYDKTPRI